MEREGRTISKTGSGVLDGLSAQPADSLLSLIVEFRDDQRDRKIDVGVGVYKDANGDTPVFSSIKAAEAILLNEQASKKYLGPAGDVEFFQALNRLVFPNSGLGDRVTGVQTPGGTGALRLGADLIMQAKGNARIFVGTPTWTNHLPILSTVGFELVEYTYYDRSKQRVLFDDMLAMLNTASRGDVVLLQGCCHNPTGADLSDEQWRQLTRVICERGLLPFIDFAYHGLGRSPQADAYGVRHIFEHVEEAILAYSCDKNFGLYRERTGALFALTANGQIARKVQSNILSVARANWSMPPDHGAAAARIILTDEALKTQWLAELAAMQTRIQGVRENLAARGPWFDAIGRQRGMFSMLALTPSQIDTLRKEYAVYMASSGRVNLAGLTPETIDQFASAVQSVIGT